MFERTQAARRLPSLKLTIVAILFVVLLPTLGIVTVALYSANRSYQDASTRQLLETARTMARSTVSELELIADVLRNLTQLGVQDAQMREHLSSVHSFASGQLQTHHLRNGPTAWTWQSQQPADPLLQELIEKAAQTGRFQVSNILPSTQAQQPLQVALAVPDRSLGTQIKVATLVTTPANLLHALSRHSDNSTSVILAITDGSGRILERSVDGDKFVGKVVPDWQRLNQQPGTSGSLMAQTLEGQQIVFAFQRIDGTPGWVAVSGESAQSFNHRSQQPIRLMLVAAALTLSLAVLLAFWLTRKTLQPIRLLAARAERIAAGQRREDQRLMEDVPPSFVAEFETLRQSLDQADLVLQQSLEESRKAEKEAQEHLAMLQAAEEQAHIGHWSFDPESGVLHCSDMISWLFGGPRQTASIQLVDLKTRLLPESYKRMQDAAHACLHDGMPYAMEIDSVRRDGHTFTAYLRGWPVYDAHGQVASIAGTLQDISEGKEQRERLAALADNLPSGAIFRLQRDASGRLNLQFLSAGLESLTGLAANTLLTHQNTLLKAIAPAHMRRMLRVLQRAQRSGHVLAEEFQLRTAHGDVLWLHCRAALRYPATGGAVWDGIVRDVTYEREAEAALLAAKEAAETAERAKSDFLATMSHEIRTPMNSVIGMARLALRTQLDAKQRNYLEKINESANVLLGIINDILDFSKIEAGGMVLEKMPFQIESVFNTVASVTALKAEEKGLEITFAMDPNVPAVVRGDSLRLGQVLTNLVSNAVKFTQAGDVLVRVSRQGPLHLDQPAEQDAANVLHFEVIDTGMGLSETQIAGLFHPFSQAQGDISRLYGGTGLGLAISKRLVEMMGGSIGVRSMPGQGSTFFFSLPLEAVAQPELALISHAKRTALQGRRILIADDNAIARSALAEMAQGFGMQAILATNGQEAIDTLHSYSAQGQDFDIVVLDWRMPIMDGVEAARCIKQDAHLKRMPAVLMVTAYGQDAMLQACQGVPVQGVLLKPVTQSTMFNTLTAASALLGAVSAERVEEGVPATDLHQPDLSAYAALRGKRVLVADDNALNREVASDFLAGIGVQVLSAHDGLQAIDMLQQHAVDAVLMDIQMPHMDGLTATREIRRHACWQHLPIIALTAQARREDVQLSLAAGMNGHLSKPIDEEALYSALLEHCLSPAQTLGTAVAADILQPAAAIAQRIPANQLGNRPMLGRLPGSAQRRAQLLRGFLHDFGQLPQHWPQWVEQEAWKELADWAHKLKGSAGYLEAFALCKTADALESAARNARSAEVLELQTQFLALLQVCLDEVRQVVEALEQQSSSDAVQVSSDQLLSLIAQVRPLVKTGNFAAQAVLEQIVQSVGSGAGAAIAMAAVEAFDDLEQAQTLACLEQLEQLFQPNNTTQ